MSLLAQLYDFVPGQTIQSGQVDDSFLQLTDTLSGARTDKNIQIAYNHATDPPLILNQNGAGVVQKWQVSGVDTVTLGHDGLITGPATDPSSANQLARKAYVDGKKIPFTFSWHFPAPATDTLNVAIDGYFIVPATGICTLTEFSVIYGGGSHTSGGSVSFDLIQIGSGTIATVSLNNTNNAINTVYAAGLVDVTKSAGIKLVGVVSARSGTITETHACAVLEGYYLPG